jgi:uncharacterized integral membrane protein
MIVTNHREGPHAPSYSTKDVLQLRAHTQTTPANMPEQNAPTAPASVDSTIPPAKDEFPPPNTARARESAATTTGATGAETRSGRLRRNFHQGRLQGYAIAAIALIAILIALAATNTARVHVDWLVGSSRVSLVWLVLAAAIIGWILGVLASVRFQWLTRAPRPPK